MRESALQVKESDMREREDGKKKNSGEKAA